MRGLIEAFILGCLVGANWGRVLPFIGQLFVLFSFRPPSDVVPRSLRRLRRADPNDEIDQIYEGKTLSPDGPGFISRVDSLDAERAYADQNPDYESVRDGQRDKDFWGSR